MKRQLAAGLAGAPALAAAHGQASLETWPWNDDAWLWVLVLAAGLAYGAGLRRLWRSAGVGRGIGRASAGAWAAGWALLALALLSPLDPLGSVSFAAHMVQHELLMLVAAPLLVVGRPLVAGTWALPARWRGPVARGLQRTGVTGAVQRLSHPVVAWLLHLVVLWGWHAPPLFEAALHHDGVHVLQHASFFVSALLYWWALVQPGRLAAVPLSVATTAMHTGVLGALLTFSTTVWYPHYRGGAGPGKLDALADQHLGGLIMWVPAGAVMLAVALAALVSLLRRLEPAPR